MKAKKTISGWCGMDRRPMMVFLAILFLAPLTSALDVPFVKAEFRTWIVDDDGIADYHSIQEAINAASPGDTIYVKNGTYYENLVLNKQNLTLIGENKHAAIINGNGSTVISLQVNDTRIEGFTVQNGINGFSMAPWTHGHYICNNIISNNRYGILGHFDCDNVSVHHNVITSNSIAGIWMLFSHSTISDNLISDNGKGEYREFSSGIQIVKGVWNDKIDYCVNNTVSCNTVRNHRIGILASQYSEGNLFHNNFVNNTRQLYTAPNTWNSTIAENYWSDYNGIDSNHDGIGDNPYFFDADNTDDSPLMGIFYNFDTITESHVNIISNSTIEEFEYLDFNNTIRMYLSNMTIDQTYGFCRVCIPKDLMAPSYYVEINDGLVEILHFNNSLHDNDTHRWIYFAYEHSTLKVLIVSELRSFLLISFLMIAILLTYVIYRKKYTL